MKQMTVISGKGGTGKTTVSAAFASLASGHVLADADVDAANLHLVLDPHIKETEDFYGSRIPVLDRAACDECGLCVTHCRFDAICDYRIDPIACEGCGVCAFVCPQGAIRMEEKRCGRCFSSETRFGPLVHARLAAGEGNSGKLVTMVRKKARAIAEETDKDLIIIDGPPGIGCAVMAAVTGVDLVVGVTEPTFSAIEDFRRVFKVAQQFNIPCMVIINKNDVNPDNAQRIRCYCTRKGITLAGELPYDPAVVRAMVAGQSITEYHQGQVSKALESAWQNVRDTLGV